ncbi:hypothetical protein [Dictyobacter aurantiacus]|uniref:Uncharacterized protein n=1 Tax=Dictyobacter aurantiacus TaxID=1936993 RepID=A0A401ZR19_9CHLR|nr:hypothetical protein [Dictyobacter aurantiacus]GCE09206.1 hypothetical protein KDAU_65350 [Dictyobacter aurantiacus]
MSRKSIGQVRGSPQQRGEAKKELQETWRQLELKPATLLHLQEVLDISGVGAARHVTEALIRQKGKQGRLADTGKEWGAEVLRLLSLQGMRPHLIDVFRVVLETLFAWHFIMLPSLTDEMLNNAVEVALALLFLIITLIGICLHCWHAHIRPTIKQRKDYHR